MFDRYIREAECLRIPLSGEGYFVDNYGEVFDKNGIRVKKVNDTDGNPTVLIN